MRADIKAAVRSADDTRVSHSPERSRRRTTVGGIALTCLAVFGARAIPAAAEGGGLTDKPAQSGPVTPADLANLDAALDRTEQDARVAAEELFQAFARSADVRIGIDDAAARADDARGALTDRVRHIYMTGKPDPLSRLLLGLREGNGLAKIASAGTESDRALIDEVETESRELDALRRDAADAEVALADKERQVATLQQRTLNLLTAAQARYADDQVRLAALAARRAEIAAQAESVRVAVAQRQVEAEQAEQARRTARNEAPATQPSLGGVRPAVTARGARAAAAEAPVIAALEAAGTGMPPGYRATGRTITGLASWYGPGFYGKPTATGAPYDAERYTCAMLAVPLGTVVRVTTDDGRAINVLVNDRGPYVGSRVIDMSAIGARTLGYSGIKKVTIEVLEPLG